MAEPFTIYKLTILNLLDKVDFPLSNTQLSNFFLEHDYTNYFYVQQTINDLLKSELISAKSANNRTQYTITAGGKATLHILRDKISDAIDSDTTAYLEKNRAAFRLANSIYADYKKTANDEYDVHCHLETHGKNLIDLTISVPKLKQAKAICSNWKKQNEDVYDYLMDILMK